MIRLLIPFIGFLFIKSGSISDKWIKYESGDHKFSIEFPEQPVLSEIPYISDFGPTTNYRIHFDATDDKKPEFLYYIDYSDFNKNVSSDSLMNEYYLNMISAMTYGQGFGRTHEKNIQLKGYEGREFVIDVHKDHVVLKCQLYFVENRLYMLQVGTYDSQLDSPELNRFFDSFTLFE